MVAKTDSAGNSLRGIFFSSTYLLTDDREYDGDEVPEVPNVLEVVPSKAEQFKDEFEKKDDDEEEIDDCHRVPHFT